MTGQTGPAPSPSLKLTAAIYILYRGRPKIRGGSMSWWGPNRPNETYYSVGRLTRGSNSGLFLRLPLPGGDVVRVMDKGLHVAALEQAGRRLHELNRKSGKLWSSQ